MGKLAFQANWSPLHFRNCSTVVIKWIIHLKESSFKAFLRTLIFLEFVKVLIPLCLLHHILLLLTRNLSTDIKFYPCSHQLHQPYHKSILHTFLSRLANQLEDLLLLLHSSQLLLKDLLMQFQNLMPLIYNITQL